MISRSLKPKDSSNIHKKFVSFDLKLSRARFFIARAISSGGISSIERRDWSSSAFERCMKHTVHPIRHPSVHPRIFGRVGSRRSCAWHDDQFGRRQNTGLGWSDPTFVHVSVPKVIRGVAPAQLRGDRAEYIVRVQIGSGTIAKTVRNPVKFANQTRSRKRGPQ